MQITANSLGFTVRGRVPNPLAWLDSNRTQEYPYAIQKQGFCFEPLPSLLDKMSIQQNMHFQSGLLKVDASGEFSLEDAKQAFREMLGALLNIRLRKYCSMARTVLFVSKLGNP